MVLETTLKMVRIVMLGFPGRKESSLSPGGGEAGAWSPSHRQREWCAHQKLGVWSEICAGCGLSETYRHNVVGL